MQTLKDIYRLQEFDSSSASIQLPGLLSLSTKFLPTVMNLLRKLAEEGQRPANPTTQQNPPLDSKSFRGNASEYSGVSSSGSSTVTVSENGNEYVSPSKND